MTPTLRVAALLVAIIVFLLWLVFGPGGEALDRALAQLDDDDEDDLMAVADAVQGDVYGVEEPIPYLPADPLPDLERAWLRSIGVDA